MTEFRVCFTGDYLNAEGEVAVGDIALDLFASAPWVRIDFLRSQQPAADDPGYWKRLYALELEADHVTGAHGIVVLRPWVKPAAFAAGSGDLTVIGRAGAGYDKIDLPACTAHDVAVFNAPDTLAHSTAASAFVLMLALAMRLPEHQQLVRQGSWDRQAAVIGNDLSGMTLGIVGLGKSGSLLANMARPFGMRILAYSPHADPRAAQQLGVALVDRLDDVFEQADFVSLHCRLTAERHGMIGERHLRLLRPSAYFINVARGELVDQPALVRCLSQRALAGAGLDVFAHEPLPLDDPLLRLDNVILTPHWLPSTRQAVRATSECMVRGMLAASQGRVPAHVLNPDVLERPRFREKLARFAANGPALCDARPLDDAVRETGRGE